MSSPNAEAVGIDVVKTIRKGTKVNKGYILKKHGYSDSVSKHPKTVTETKSYQKAVEPMVKKLKSEIDRLQKELGSRNLSGEDYKILTDALDKQIKNYQLLSGNETERVGIFKLEDLFKANENK